MSCKFHPMTEAVTTCAVCGAGMCSVCDAGAFAVLKKNEQPLCIECAFKEAEENVNFGERYLKIMKIKLIFASIFVVLSILPIISTLGIIFGDGEITNIIFMIGFLILFWFLAGRILVAGKEKMKNMSDRISLGLVAPSLLIRSFREYSERKAEQPLNVQRYEEIKAALDDINQQHVEQ